jgi:hypothetical protein
MTKKLLRFERCRKLNLLLDFKQPAIDKFKSFINEIYNQGKSNFEVKDFAHIFEYSDLNIQSKNLFTNNTCQIKFEKIIPKLTAREEPFTLDQKVRDDLRYINVYFMLLSASFEFKEEDDVFYFMYNGSEREISKSHLKLCNIQWAIL